MRADVGIALDGNADRMIIVDEKGHLIDGDQVMAVIAESWRDEGRLAKPGIVATVMSNLGLERRLRSLGLTLERTAVGDRYVIERMREKGFNVGGEQSGHIVLSDYATTATAWWRRCRCWRLCIEFGKPTTEVCRRFEPVPQILRNVRFNGGKPLKHPGWRRRSRRRPPGSATAGRTRDPSVRHRAGHPKSWAKLTTRRWSTPWSAMSARPSPAPPSGLLSITSRRIRGKPTPALTVVQLVAD